MDDNRRVQIWHVGNTGLRNPNRIHEGFIAFSKSQFVGNLHEKDNEIGFMQFLNDSGIIHNEEGKDTSGSHARKWRLMFEKYGFIYGQAKESDTFEQSELGELDHITPFGRTFCNATSVPEIQECFLRSLGVEQYNVSEGKGMFSPFRWILAIMLELERRTGSSELSRIEFALWGQTTDPSYDLKDVVDQILALREHRYCASSKKRFDKEMRARRALFYLTAAGKQLNPNNFNDYADMNMRYLRTSGVLQRKGRGLIIVPEKHVIAERMAKSVPSDTTRLEQLRLLVNGAPLPTDNLDIAKTVLDDLREQARQKHVLYDISDISLDNVINVNMARLRIESAISQENEIKYAEEQRDKWQEIADYMSLIISGGGRKEYNEDYVIEVPKDEMPVYLEWILWRAILAIDHLKNAPYKIRGFKIDSDFMPVSTAGGGRGDLYCEFDKYVILTEVTMSTSSRQEAMEGEPVRRHVSDAVLQYDKPVYGMFIAVRIDTNTAETFRHGIWYAKGDEKQRLDIVPFSLKQFQHYFVDMFKRQQAHPDNICDIILKCCDVRDDMEAPDWKQYIENTIYEEKGA